MNTHVMFDKLSTKDFDQILGLKVVIFDFDNTLYDNVNWGKGWAEFVLKKIEDLLSFLPKGKVKSLIEKYNLNSTNGRLFEKAFNLFASGDVPLTTKDFRNLTATFFYEPDWTGAKTIPNELLRELAKKYKLYVVSNSSESVIRFDCEKLGIDTTVFTKIIQNRFDPKDLSKKADYLAVMERENATADETLVVGDSNFYDIDPAKEVGTHTILLCGEYNKCPNMQRAENMQNKNVKKTENEKKINIQSAGKDQKQDESSQNLTSKKTLTQVNDFNQTEEVLSELKKKNKRMIVAFAPSVRVSLGEMFGAKVGQNLEKKIVTALKLLGFDDVFDIDYGADLTIVEEAEEFAQFMQKKWTTDDENVKKSTFFTSCCPAWVKFVQKGFPQFKDNISTCKSPQEITSTIAKTYYAKKLNLSPEDIYFVAIMPCVAKKFERFTNKFVTDMGEQKCYTDAVLTVREFGEILKNKKINLTELDDGKFDLPMGVSSGAGVIFGTAGGVMESALRTLEAKFSKDKNIKTESLGLEFLLEKGKNGIKEGVVQIAGKNVNIAVVSGLAPAGELLRAIASGQKQYDFVEVMACSGGCVNGSGMPLCTLSQEAKEEIIAKRAMGLRTSDKKNKLRKSIDNPEVTELYKNYLGKIGGEKAHQLLHTNHERE